MRVDDVWVNSVVEKQAKLNELSEHQFEAVKNAVRDGIGEGLDIGHYNGGMEAVNRLTASQEKFLNVQLNIRTFFSGLSGIFVLVSVIGVLHITNFMAAAIISTSINTLGYYVIIKATDWLRNRLAKKNDAGTST
jgi:hypothetical protein